MARKIAVDWDEHELRIVAGRTSPSGVTVTDLWAVPLDAHDQETVTTRLREELEAHGYAKQDALLAIGRGKAELRQLKLPPIPEAELPEVVRFQATRNFATAGERAITDFVPSRSTAENTEVVAAALDPNQLEQLRHIGAGAGVDVQRVALRPLSAAALFAAKQPTEGEIVLIDLLADDADIVVLRDGKARFVRSVRLSSDPETRPAALAGEVRRSLMACRDSTDATECSRRMVIWGRDGVHQQDIRVLSERSGDPVTTVDPLSLVDVDRKLIDQGPEHIGRFAPLIGLLQIDESGSELLIDFLNPRKPPEPRNDRLRYTVYGSAAAAAALLIGYLVWNNLSTRDARIAELQQQLDGMSKTVEMSNDQVAKVAQVDEFLSGNVVWLEEIRRVATEMPPSKEAILTRLAASVPRQGGGELTLAGAVTSPDVIDKMEAALRDEQHRVGGVGATADSTEGPYDWGFRETVVIDPDVVLAMRREADQRPQTEPAQPEPAQPETGQSEPAQPERANPEPVQPEPASSEPAQAETAQPEPSPPDDATGDQAKPEDNEADSAEPPVVREVEAPTDTAAAAENDTAAPNEVREGEDVQ